MGRTKLTRKAAESTYQLGLNFNTRIREALGLNQKSYKFHSLPQPSPARYYRCYMEDFHSYGFGPGEWTIHNYNRYMRWVAFVLCFSAAYFVMRLEYDESLNFYYYINYPVLMKLYDVAKERWKKFDAYFFGFLDDR